MRFITSTTFALLLSACSSELTRQECMDQGGEVVGDIGDGAIFDPEYLCAVDGLPPIDVVIASPDEPIAIEGEVCCGGNNTNATFIPDDDDDDDGSAFARPEINLDECEQQGGYVVNDIGDGAIHRDDYLCELTGVPPIGTVIPREGEPMAREGQVCCPVPEQGLVVQRDEYTRQQCLDENGVIVGDIGDGAIFEEGYICESNGLPPLANIVQSEEPFAIEGEVCCGQVTNLTDVVREEITREDCETQGGAIIGDIGDGAIFEESYICESNGLPPLANIVQSEEPFAIEGEVCCGQTTPTSGTAVREEITREDCETQGGAIVGDIGDGAIFVEGYICESNGLPPLANIVQSEEPFAIEGEVCCGEGANMTSPVNRGEITWEECEDQGGEIIGDIGDGAIFEDSYICENTGLPPLANIMQNEDIFATEGEVCCGGGANMTGTNTTDPVDRDEITREECEEQGGEIVGDIGDGATLSDEYLCESSGEPPIANVIAGEGEPLASEGEVCCGLSSNLADSELNKDSAAMLSFGYVAGLMMVVLGAI